MPGTNLTREEARQRAAVVSDASYDVALDLTLDGERFGSVTTLTFAAQPGASTFVDLVDGELTSVTLNGRELDLSAYADSRIAIDGLEARNELVVTGTCLYSHSGEGLHRFVDPTDDRVYLYTQFEVPDARRVFATFEQPDLKAQFTFHVTAPAHWKVVSNSPTPEPITLDGGSAVWHFEPTKTMSTYITALVAGEYHEVRDTYAGSYGQIPLGVFCRQSLVPFLDADDIFAITKQGFEFFEGAFQMGYPFGKYDQLFVPEYNMGAMENAGAVTFRDEMIFRSRQTVSAYEQRANTILHEMAHMWFGDLVTMTWWDDLWLKESFADYMGALVSAEATEFTDAWVAFANRRKAWAYLQDQLPTTHPIVADIGDLEAAKLNFDGITYAKGASVLKQLVAFVGRDAFFEGARRYFRRHAFGNTTLADLLAELSATSGRDLSGWARAWLQTSGVSTLTLEDAGEGRSAIVQRPARPHRLAVGHYDFDEHGDLVCRRRVEVDLESERTPIECASAPLILLNDADLTYAKVRLDPRSLETVEHSLDRVADPLARGLIWSALWNATRDGELSAARYLAAVRRFAVSESNPALLTALTANASYAIEHYLPMTSRPEQRRLWLEAAWTATFTAAPGSDGQLAWARAVATAATVDDTRAAELRAMLDGTGKAPQGLRSDPDLRWQLWTALAATGHAEPADLDGELARDDTGSGRTARLRALAARPLAAVKEQAWTAILTDTALSNEHLDATIAGFRAGAHRELIAPFDDDYFAAIRTVWSERSIEMARRIVVGLFPAGDTLEPSDRWLDAHADAPAALRRLVVEQRDHLARDLRAQALG